MNAQEFKEYIRKINLENYDFLEKMKIEENVQEEWKKLEE